jgi:hypothetical protein
VTNEIIRAGHRYFGLGYLILAEDGESPRNDDPELPRDVLRVTIATGRQVDLVGESAGEFRRALIDREPIGEVVHGRRVQSSSGRPVKSQGGRRRRIAE